MALIPKDLQKQLVANGRKNREIAEETGGETTDFVPVVKLFMPEGAATWLITEVDPHDPYVAFGLADMGFGCPELGYFDLREIASVRTPQLGLPVERDLHFDPKGKTLSQFAQEARENQGITA